MSPLYKGESVEVKSLFLHLMGSPSIQLLQMMTTLELDVTQSAPMSEEVPKP